MSVTVRLTPVATLADAAARGFLGCAVVFLLAGSGIAHSATAPTSYTCTVTKQKIDDGVFGLCVTYRGQVGLPALAGDAGVKWVRLDFHWGYIDPLDGTYRWTPYDTVIEQLQQRGIQILATIDDIPASLLRASTADWTPVYDRYYTFAQALTKRYKPGGTLGKQYGWGTYGIRYWEVFNEPNLPGYGWLVSGADPTKFTRQYAQLLRYTNAAMRSQDANAVILMGGLSRMTPGGTPPENFIDAVYAQDAGSCFDVVGYHPYGLIDRLATAGDDITPTLAAHGDGAKPVWLDEFGSPDEADREAFLYTVFQQKSALRGFFWFTLVDPAPTGRRYGLVRYDGTRNPSYDLFKQLMHAAP